MSFRTTIILVVLLAVLGGIYLLVPKPESTDQGNATEPRTGTTERAFVFDPRPEVKNLVRIDVQRAGKPALLFERPLLADGTPDTEAWQMRTPLDVATDRWRVDEIGRTFGQLRLRGRVAADGGGGITPADAGLEPPRATVTLTDKDGQAYVLDVGGPVALSDDTYVRRAGDSEILVAARDLSKELDRELHEYRSKTVLEIDPAEMVRVEFASDDQNYKFVKNETVGWVIEAPIRGFADEKALADSLHDLANLRAVSFVELKADAPVCGFDDPYVAVRVTTEKQQPIVVEDADPAETQPTEPEFETVRETVGLVIGATVDLEGENRYAHLADQTWVFTVTSALANKLKPAFSKLRDHRVTRLAENDITQINITTGDQTVVLERSDGAWRGSGAIDEIDEATVAELVKTLAGLQAIDFVDNPDALSDYGLDSPRATLDIQARSLPSPLRLKIGAASSSGRNTFVQVAGRDSVLVVAASGADKIALTPLDLRSRQVLDLSDKHIKRIELTRDTQRYVLVQTDGQWQFETPAGAPVDAAGIRSLTTNLAALRAQRVLAPDAATAAALQTPNVVVHIEGDAPTTQPADAVGPAAVAGFSHTLTVAFPGTTILCQRDDDPYIYELEATLALTLRQELIDRRLFDFTVDDVRDFKVEAPDGTLHLVRKGIDWTYPADPYLKLWRKKIRDFLKELAEMRVERYLQYSDADAESVGMADAAVTVTIGLDGDETITLKIDQHQRGALPRLALWPEAHRTFMLRAADAERLLRSVDAYVQPENAPDTAPDGQAP